MYVVHPDVRYGSLVISADARVWSVAQKRYKKMRSLKYLYSTLFWPLPKGTRYYMDDNNTLLLKCPKRLGFDDRLYTEAMNAVSRPMATVCKFLGLKRATRALCHAFALRLVTASRTTASSCQTAPT